MKRLLPFIAIFLALIISFGTIYAAVQQAQRNDANYPQIQLAEDMAAELNAGADGLGLLDNPKVDLAHSLAPFTIIYDKNGRPIVGSGYLDHKLPKAPLAVLKAAQNKDYNAVTWQPKKDVRIAAVTVAAKNYYVLSGRSLKEVEKNENTTLEITLLGGLLTMLVIGLGILLPAATASPEDY